jgi:transaldolase
VDRAIDATLAERGVEVALSGIYNTADIYNEIERMKVSGCRALFASTGVKGDSLPPHYYVERLLAYNSVNTAPVDTIKAYHKDGGKNKALPIPQNVIEAHFEKVKNAGIDIDKILDEQIADGLDAFKDAFKDILEAL